MYWYTGCKIVAGLFEMLLVAITWVLKWSRDLETFNLVRHRVCQWYTMNVITVGSGYMSFNMVCLLMKSHLVVYLFTTLELNPDSWLASNQNNTNSPQWWSEQQLHSREHCFHSLLSSGVCVYCIEPLHNIEPVLYQEPWRPEQLSNLQEKTPLH